MSEIRAKIKGKFIKVSKTKQNFRLRRAKRAKSNLNINMFMYLCDFFAFLSRPKGEHFILDVLTARRADFF